MKLDVQIFREPCTCGHQHTIVVDDIVIEEGALAYLPNIMKEKYSQYQHVAMLCDENTYEAAGKKVKDLYPEVIVLMLSSNNLHADEHGVKAAAKLLDQHKEIDFLIACGAGTIHDITRFHCYEKQIPFLSIPTAASVDGYVSTVAAMTWHGFKKSFTAVSPIFVLADTDVFSKAPKRLSASGVGDLLGKYTALCDWKIAHVVTGEYICNRVVELEESTLKELVNNLDGLASGDSAAYENLMYGLLLSGLAMQMIGNSRPASGAEHHLSHLWEMCAINKPIDYYHGEKVGVGLCIALQAYEKAKEELRKSTYLVKNNMDVEIGYIWEQVSSKALQDEMLKENSPNLLENIKGSVLKAKEHDIIEILDALPSAQEVINMLKKIGGVTTMSELSLDEELLSTSLRLSPYARQRLTFMRLIKFYDFYEDVTKG